MHGIMESWSYGVMESWNHGIITMGCSLDSMSESATSAPSLWTLECLRGTPGGQLSVGEGEGEEKGASGSCTSVKCAGCTSSPRPLSPASLDRFPLLLRGATQSSMDCALCEVQYVVTVLMAMQNPNLGIHFEFEESRV